MSNTENLKEEIEPIKVLPVTQPIGTFFIGSIPAKDLTAISYSDVRRLASEQRDVERFLGIQRPISPRRIKDIRKYIDSPDASFPTAVIVAVDERCAEYDEDEGLLYLSEYIPEDDSEDPIPISKIAKILDGQHRLAGFLDEDKNWAFDLDEERRFDINVAIFIGADISEQANLFATVNLAQTRVNKSLVYDLMELAKTKSPYKTCHNIAVTLDETPESPFEGRIKRLGVATPGRTGETITQASFVEALVGFISEDPLEDRNRLMDGYSLKRANQQELLETPFRNMFIDDKEIDIAEIVFNYFSTIRDRWPKSWAEPSRKGNLLPRTNAFKAFMRYLREDVYCDIVQGDFGYVPSSSEFEPYLRNMELTDADFTSRNFVPGSGGQATFLKLLRGQIRAADVLEGP